MLMKFKSRFYFILMISANNAHMIKVYNKGWFLASVRIDYELYNLPFKYPIQLPAILGFNEQATFFVPDTLPINQRIGIVFTAEAIGGVRIFSFKVPSLPLCVHIWGSTLIPYWTFIDCSKFIS